MNDEYASIDTTRQGMMNSVVIAKGNGAIKQIAPQIGTS